MEQGLCALTRTWLSERECWCLVFPAELRETPEYLIPRTSPSLWVCFPCWWSVPNRRRRQSGWSRPLWTSALLPPPWSPGCGMEFGSMCIFSGITQDLMGKVTINSTLRPTLASVIEIVAVPAVKRLRRTMFSDRLFAPGWCGGGPGHPGQPKFCGQPTEFVCSSTQTISSPWEGSCRETSGEEDSVSCCQLSFACVSKSRKSWRQRERPRKGNQIVNS